MSYEPKDTPPTIFFDRWRIYHKHLHLYFTYVSSSKTGFRFRFEAHAPTVTSPIAFDPAVRTKLDTFFVIVPPSLPASAEILFDPDVIVTWGGPIITLRLSISSSSFDQFDFTVHLPAYTDPVSLDGKVVRL